MKQVKLVTVVSPVRHTVLEVISYPDLLIIDDAEGEIWSSIFNITCKTILYLIFRDFLKLSLEINEDFWKWQ